MIAYQNINQYLISPNLIIKIYEKSNKKRIEEIIKGKFLQVYKKYI